MSRIISGLAGSRKLIGPAAATRPTSDRVRESLFAKLAAWDVIEGARVLDLYAGTGALGLEAMSRGAASLTLVEKDRAAAAVCLANADMMQDALAKAGVEADIRVSTLPVFKFLDSAAGRFDLIFVDPPYDLKNEKVSEDLESLVSLLAESATVILERSARTEVPEIPSRLEISESKNYGDTTVYFLSLI